MEKLLIPRRPNLNSVLSLEMVHGYLDQSLPIPNDLLQHAATTLKLMDTLRDEIARLKKAYRAVEQLLVGPVLRLCAC